MPDSMLEGQGIPGDADSSTIGVVEAVSPGVIEVAVLQEAPHGTGLRSGGLHRFPRINGFVVLPSERGSVLALVVWIGIDDDSRRALGDPDRIGLPTPRRRLKALPLGVLRQTSTLLDAEPPALVLDRGVLLFPTVGDPVRLPTKSEAAAAVPAVNGQLMTVPIGRAPLAGDAVVRVDPNKLFGRHLAVLGNTGSGKSCSVAQILRRSVLEAGEGIAGFRAIVLDLNDEYGDSFDDLGSAVAIRRFSVVPSRDTHEQLRLPAWLWNYREWLSFTEASAKSQAPQLRRALHLLRTTDVAGMPPEVVSLVAGRHVVRMYASGAVEAKANSDCLSRLDNVLVACKSLEDGDLGANVVQAAHAVASNLNPMLAERRGTGEYLWKYGARQLDHTECGGLLPLLDSVIELSGVPDVFGEGFTVDSPRPFDAKILVELLPVLAASSGAEVVGWITPLVERLRILLADDRVNALSGWVPGESLEAWLSDYLADGNSSQIAVLDLSLVPASVLHLVAAVIVRLVLEALERHRRTKAPQLPVVLVAEEAHALMRRHVDGSEDDQTVVAARLCREAFERVAREGRKFGLSLVVSSQRPSELSETVLSQCNTFLIHRIVNDYDQRLVRRLIPDSLGPMTDELPALPSQIGLLVGWAIDMPTMVRIDDLEERYRPQSADPEFSKTWKGLGASVSWASIAKDWIAASSDEPDQVAGDEEASPELE